LLYRPYRQSQTSTSRTPSGIVDANYLTDLVGAT
jgi:hypothetical protein